MNAPAVIPSRSIGCPPRLPPCLRSPPSGTMVPGPSDRPVMLSGSEASPRRWRHFAALRLTTIVVASRLGASVVGYETPWDCRLRGKGAPESRQPEGRAHGPFCHLSPRIVAVQLWRSTNSPRYLSMARASRSISSGGICLITMPEESFSRTTSLPESLSVSKVSRAS